MRKFESWQIFNVAMKNLGHGVLQHIYTRSTRLVYYWAANPRYNSKSERNPIDRIRDMLDALDDIGKGEYARAAIDYMAEPLGGRFVDNETSVSDKGNVDGEIADIAVALGELASRIREAKTDGIVDTAERIRIKNAARTIKQEVEQLLDAAGIKE